MKNVKKYEKTWKNMKKHDKMFKKGKIFQKLSKMNKKNHIESLITHIKI